MRSRLLTIACLSLCAACGEADPPTVGDRLDAMIEAGATPVHQSLPSPARKAELSIPVVADGVRPVLLETTHGRALLEAGQAVVPDLVGFLDDEERGTLAAVFLAEIGGEEAAQGLLDVWRSLRGHRVTKHTYTALEESAEPMRIASGFRHEGVRHVFYGELLMALAYAGLPVSAEIASDTLAAVKSCEKRRSAGETLGFEEEEGDERRKWSDPEVETATEGLRILAMLGAAEAVDQLVRALASPIEEFRWTAAQNAYWLGKDVDPVLPSLVRTLDDPSRGLRVEALRELLSILELPVVDYTIEDEELEDAVARVKDALRTRGHRER